MPSGACDLVRLVIIAVPVHVAHIVAMRPPSEVGDMIVLGIIIPMAYLHAFRSLSDKSSSH